MSRLGWFLPRIVLILCVYLVVDVAALNWNNERLGGPYRRLSACRANMMAMSHAVERYAMQHDGRPPRRLDDLVPRYMAHLPRCPATRPRLFAVFPLGPATDSYAPGYSSANATYTLTCAGAWHVEAGQGPDEPRCTSGQPLWP